MDTTMLRTQLCIRPPGAAALLQVDTYGLHRIGITTPSSHLDHRAQQQFSGLRLADPQFHVLRGIDLLLGANIYSSLIFSRHRALA